MPLVRSYLDFWTLVWQFAWPNMMQLHDQKALLLALSMSSLGLLAGPHCASSTRMLQKAKTMDRMYNFCVGAGRANEGLRADWQRQLKEVRAECGSATLGFTGCFATTWGSIRRQVRPPIYNWQYVDELLDFLQSIG